jgi:hypothetical protein
MSKKKNILDWFLVVFLIGISTTIISAKGNFPSSIGIVYNSGTKQVDVTITHNNGGTPGHYIEEVTIRVNGSIVNTSLYVSQPSVTFTYNYGNITANPGATIQATVVCTFSGPSSNSIVIPGGTPSNGNGQPSIPGYLGFLIIVVISFLGILFIQYKRVRRVNY